MKTLLLSAGPRCQGLPFRTTVMARPVPPVRTSLRMLTLAIMISASTVTLAASGQPVDGAPAGHRSDTGEPSVPAPSARGTRPAALAGRESLPVWEVGVGASALTLPDYRGADTRQRYLIPFPVLVYRAPHLKVDRGGIRADLWDDERYELDLSVNVAPPVKRHATGIRAGMPGRKALLELGPRLQRLMWTGDEGRQRLKLHLPLRYAMPLGKLDNAGLVFHPKLVLDIDHVGGWRGWRLSLAAGPIFANRAHHRYYYEVDPVHARPGRPAWSARGGYGGMQYTASFNKRFPDYWVAGFVRLDQVQGAAFASSPLVRQRSQLSAGLVFGWLFARSAERVAQRD